MFWLVLLSFTLNGCFITLREALLMKSQGQKTMVPLSYNDAYTATRTALRWSSDDPLEDHKEQGYVMLLMNTRYRSTTYQRFQIVWLDSLSANETELTILTSGMAANPERNVLELNEKPSIWEIQRNISYAVSCMQAGKPLPIMLAPQDRFRDPRTEGSGINFRLRDERGSGMKFKVHDASNQ
ncbi:MAG: hypothetical protein EAZ92_13355 [Candidatus Kapaibacterium sp.]|nr:MAG: hypothetical protein EAZ92_13355 [Candidatus Kapabacteria bacterium]